LADVETVMKDSHDTRRRQHTSTVMSAR